MLRKKALYCLLIFLIFSFPARSENFEGFMNVLRAINGYEVNLNQDIVEEATQSIFTRKAIKNRIVYSSEEQIEGIEKYNLTIRQPHGAYFFTLNFTEPTSVFRNILEQEEVTFDVQTSRANGLKIWNYLGVKHNYGLARGPQVHIAIYECSDNPSDPCIKQAQMKRFPWRTLDKHDN